MTVTYVAGDGAVFKTEQAALDYDQDLARDTRLQDEATRFLDLQEWPAEEKSAKRERSKAERWIHAWLSYDARQRPERYAEQAPIPIDPLR